MNTYSINHDQTLAYNDHSSQQELRKANDVIGQFITSCSHSMRGPIKSIEGLVNLIQSTPKNDPNISVFLNLIVSVTDKMEHQLDEMEHFLENTNRQLSVSKVDFRSLLESITRNNRKEIDASKLNVSIEIIEDVPFYGDSARIGLVLKNLLENAIHFRDDGKAQQLIRIKVDIKHAMCDIQVTDNGVGIPAEFIKKIFQLFFRASEKSAGTGIGLYIVDEVVSKMGGTINVTSEPGKGSVFSISIPNSRITSGVFPA